MDDEKVILVFLATAIAPVRFKQARFEVHPDGDLVIKNLPPDPNGVRAIFARGQWQYVEVRSERQ
jgi:hypothetical protein